MRILISGGTGLVGTALVEKLRQKGHTVKVLVRSESEKTDEFFWDYQKNKIDEKAFENIEVIIHLAGASIGKRWINSYKKKVISSRVDSAQFLFDECKKRNIKLKAFISASGINYYGTFTSEKILTENDGILHRDFLSEVCEQWEDGAHSFTAISDRVVILRTSPVLSKKGGSFEQLKKISNFNLASGIGSGKQWFNWIHEDDIVNMYLEAVENVELKGAYNAVADEVPKNKDFMKRLAKANKKLFIPINVPSFLMKAVLGQMSEMILEGTRVSNDKIKSSGFEFKYPKLDEALESLVR